MAQGHGRAAVFLLEDSSGTMRDVSSDLNDITVDITVNNPEDTAFGDTFVTRSASGIADYTLSLSGFFNDTNNTGLEDVLEAILADVVLFDYAPAGSASGRRHYSGCVLIDNFSVNSPVDGKITLTAGFSGAAGSLTRAAL